MLKRLQFADIPADCSEPVDPKALEQAKVIVSAIRNDGEKGMLQYATKFGDVKEGEQWWADKEELKAAYDTLDAGKRDVLTRVGERIRAFAKAQRASICDTETDIPGGKAGQLVTPVDCAGCYAPGGTLPAAIVGAHDGGYCARGGSEECVGREPAPRPGHEGCSTCGGCGRPHQDRWCSGGGNAG